MVLHQSIRIHPGPKAGALHSGSHNPWNLRADLYPRALLRQREKDCHDRQTILGRVRSCVTWTNSNRHRMGISSKQSIPAVTLGRTVAYRPSIIRWFLTYRNGTRIWFRVRIREMEEGKARRLARRQEANTVQEGPAILFV